jgi:DNA-binding phage protein
MPLKTKPFDAADSLTSPELIDGYLDEAIATGNPAVIRLALSVVARARRRLAVKRRATAALRTDPARGRTLDAPGS